MDAKAQMILDLIRSKQATNINNILTTTNNTNNTNNKITSIIVDGINNGEQIELRSSLGSSASQKTLKSRDPINFVGGLELPQAWMNFKWDLFQNPSDRALAQLKINLNIVRQDGTQVKLTASLNSPHDRIWRKVSDEQRQEEHWRLIREEYTIWRKTYGSEVSDWRASKFYIPGKKDSTSSVVFLREEQDEYLIRFFYRAKMLDYVIPKSSYENLTTKQIRGNQRATLFVGRRQKMILTEDDLGI